MSVLRHAERAHGTGTILVITTAEEMIHGADTGTAGVDGDVYSLPVSLRARVVSFCHMSITVFLKTIPYLRTFLCCAI